MAVKKRAKKATEQQADQLANDLADRTYGETKEKLVATSITINKSVLEKLEDIALANKRNNVDPKNVSAIIRLAVDDYIN